MKRQEISATNIVALNEPTFAKNFKLVDATHQHDSKYSWTNIMINFLVTIDNNTYKFTHKIELRRTKSEFKQEIVDKFNEQSEILATYFASRYIDGVTKEASFVKDGKMFYSKQTDEVLDSLFLDTNDKVEGHEHFAKTFCEIVNGNLVGKEFTIKTKLITTTGTNDKKFVTHNVKPLYFNKENIMTVVPTIGVNGVHNDVMPFTQEEIIKNSDDVRNRIAIMNQPIKSNTTQNVSPSFDFDPNDL